MLTVLSRPQLGNDFSLPARNVCVCHPSTEQFEAAHLPATASQLTLMRCASDGVLSDASSQAYLAPPRTCGCTYTYHFDECASNVSAALLCICSQTLQPSCAAIPHTRSSRCRSGQDTMHAVFSCWKHDRPLNLHRRRHAILVRVSSAWLHPTHVILRGVTSAVSAVFVCIASKLIYLLRCYI